jgi:hypothetical protein
MEAAILKKDSKTVGELVANDYAAVTIRASTRIKAPCFRAWRRRQIPLLPEAHRLKVHVYAPNVAVAIGDAAEKGTDKEGKSFDRFIVSPTPGWSAVEVAMHREQVAE